MILGFLFLAFLPIVFLGFDTDSEDQSDSSETTEEYEDGSTNENIAPDNSTNFLLQLSQDGSADPNYLEQESKDAFSPPLEIDEPLTDVSRDSLSFEKSSSDVIAHPLETIDRTIELYDFDGVDYKEEVLSSQDDIFSNLLDGGDVNSPGALFDIHGTPALHSDGSVALIYGNEGNDRVITGNGAAMVDGGVGDDELFASNGASVLFGGAGNDLLMSSEENQTFSVGGDGDDIVIGGSGNDWLYGDDFATSLNDHAGSDALYGGGGDDILVAGAGADRLDGGDGNDVLRLDLGDFAIGGSGADQFEISNVGNTQDGPVIVADFEVGVDSLLVVAIDESVDKMGEAELSIERTNEDSIVLVDGVEVAVLRFCKHIQLEDIELQFI